MILLLASPSRRTAADCVRLTPTYAGRAMHSSSIRRGGIFRDPEGRWSTSTETIVGTLTLREIFAMLSGLSTIYMLCRLQDAEKRYKESEARARGFLVKGIEERRKAARLLIAARECLRQKEKEVDQENESFDEKDVRLRAETLKVLERQEKFLNDLDAGDPVEISPGHRLRKPR